MDFSPAAVDRARAVFAQLGSNVRVTDFFVDDFGTNFNLIYERTFLCALRPARWPALTVRTATLLQPGGRYAGVFFYAEEPKPPPFALRPEQANALFRGEFALVEDRAVPPEQPLPLFAGSERWLVWCKRSK